MTVQVSVTVWTVLCFAALMLILDRLLFRPLLGVMDKRRDKIDGARRARADAVREREEELSLREGARIEAEKRARREASDELSRVKEEGARRLAERQAENERRLSALDEALAEESKAILHAAAPRTDEIAAAFAARMKHTPGCAP